LYNLTPSGVSSAHSGKPNFICLLYDIFQQRFPTTLKLELWVYGQNSEVSEIRVWAQDLVTLVIQVLGKFGRSAVSSQAGAFGVQWISVEDEGCMMLSDVNETRTIVTSEAAGVARRACGECFAVFCMLRVEACRHAQELPGLRV
jgi:hypothetical protein